VRRDGAPGQEGDGENRHNSDDLQAVLLVVDDDRSENAATCGADDVCAQKTARLRSLQSGSEIGARSANRSPGPGLSGAVRPPR
jgi:hypothetical protein